MIPCLLLLVSLLSRRGISLVMPANNSNGSLCPVYIRASRSMTRDLKGNSEAGASDSD